jgi:hypothetical protein
MSSNATVFVIFSSPSEYLEVFSWTSIRCFDPFWQFWSYNFNFRYKWTILRRHYLLQQNDSHSTNGRDSCNLVCRLIQPDPKSVLCLDWSESRKSMADHA